MGGAHKREAPPSGKPGRPRARDKDIGTYSKKEKRKKEVPDEKKERISWLECGGRLYRETKTSKNVAWETTRKGRKRGASESSSKVVGGGKESV